MFSLSDLSPEREPFDLGDGRTIHFRNHADFDLQELAAWSRLAKSIERVAGAQKAAVREGQFSRAANEYDTAARELIALVLPDLPSEISSKLTGGQVAQLSLTCINVASGKIRAMSITPEQVTAVAQKYPDLPQEFISGLNRKQAGLLLGTTATEEPEKKARARQRTS